MAELRGQQKLSWKEIPAEIERRIGKLVSVATALRSYEWAHHKLFEPSAGENKMVNLGDRFENFKALVVEGITNGAELARRVGCSRCTTNRWKRRLNIIAEKNQEYEN